MTFSCKILDRAQICGKSEIFSLNMHVHCVPKWQFPLKISVQALICGKSEIFNLDMSAMDQNNDFLQNFWSGTNLWKKWNFQSGHVRSVPKWQFPIKSQFGHKFVEKVEFSVWTCPRWTKMTFSCIIDQNREISLQTWVIMEMLKRRWVVLL